MKFEFAAMTLPGRVDPAIAIAASRAAAIGIVDLSLVGDPQLAVDAVRTLARFGRHRCGVRIDPLDETTTDTIISVLRPPVELVVLMPTAPDLLHRRAESLRAADVELWLEVTTVEEARLAADLGATAVIAKGNEAGGRVGETTTFVLLQQLLAEVELPVWAHGGIGEHSAAACAVAGAAGVVLDAQLALTRESSLPAGITADLARMDGSETVCVGQEIGERYRVYGRPGTPAVEELRRLERTLGTEEADRAAWRAALADLTDRQGVWLVGQDAARCPAGVRCARSAPTPTAQCSGRARASSSSSGARTPSAPATGSTPCSRRLGWPATEGRSASSPRASRGRSWLCAGRMTRPGSGRAVSRWSRRTAPGPRWVTRPSSRHWAGSSARAATAGRGVPWGRSSR